MSDCAQREALCTCRLSADHDGPHQCGCGGAWSFDQDGEFRTEVIPGGFGSVGEAVCAILGITDDDDW